MSSRKQSSRVSFQSFGEHTSIPLTIRAATITTCDRLSSPVSRILGKCIVVLDLGVANETVAKDITSKLRLTLPMDASVKKFELLRDSQWYPATAVPKKESKAIVYKEKEKGRAVAAVSNVASGSNIFEIDISPLPYKKEVKMRVEILMNDQDVDHFVQSILPSGSSTQVSVRKMNSSSTNTKSTTVTDSFPNAGAVVGDCFGQTHFVCKIPTLEPDNGDWGKTLYSIRRMAIVWDESASMVSIHGNDDTLEQKQTKMIETRSRRLKELIEFCNSNTKSTSGPICVELYSFGIGDAHLLGKFTCTDQLTEAIRSIRHDGGTDMTALPRLVSDLTLRMTEQIDSMLVFTDGMDSLGRTPTFENTHSITFPIHCVADVEQVNTRALQCIAAASPSHPGFVFTRDDDSYVTGVAVPHSVVLRSIKTDQDDAALMGEVEDGFRCVPDHRLALLNIPIGSGGLVVAGVLNEQSSVTKLVAEVSVGGERHDCHFQLRDDGGSMEVMTADDRSHFASTTFFAGVSQDEESSNNEHNPSCSCTNPARVLGHLYAERLYEEALSVGLSSGTDLIACREDLSIRYGFCSPESSLLMLFETQQFLDHDIVPQVGHPARRDPKITELLKKKKGKGGNCQQDEKKGEGEIGGLKNMDQKRDVQNLARKLKEYFSTVEYLKEVRAKRSRSGQRGERLCLNRHSGLRRGGRGPTTAPLMARSIARMAASSECLSSASRGDDMVDFAFHEESSSEFEQDVSFSAAYSLASPAYSPTSPSFSPRSPSSSRAANQEAPRIPEQASLASLGARQDNDTDEIHRSEGIASGDRTIGSVGDQTDYTDRLDQSLDGKKEVLWTEVYKTEMVRLGGIKSATPSFFLNTARVLVKHGANSDATRIATNCLESCIENIQMMRSVGYLLLSTKESSSLLLAMQLFDRILELESSEPQSFLDAALSRCWCCRMVLRGEIISSLKGDDRRLFLEQNTTRCQELLVHVLTHAWASRFHEIEWPAMVLLHYVRDFAEMLNASLKTEVALWPKTLMDFFDEPIYFDGFDPAICIWLGWDTDKVDVDLHVTEPSGEEVMYSHNRGRAGSLLSRDFTQGYGPEVYLLKDTTPEGVDRTARGMVGEYRIHANYFASHQDSALTGATSAVLWTMVKQDDDSLEMQFHFVRLQTQSDKTLVAKLALFEK